jgi:hypothetical protein
MVVGCFNAPVEASPVAIKEKKRLFNLSTFFRSASWFVLYCKHCSGTEARQLPLLPACGHRRLLGD